MKSPYRAIAPLLRHAARCLDGALWRRRRLRDEGAAIELGWTTRAGRRSATNCGEDSVFAAGLPLTGFGRDRYRIEQELRGRAGPVSTCCSP
jgi:hypothetical protein